MTPKRIEQGYDAEEEAATMFGLAKTMVFPDKQGPCGGKM
jgi:hypothetical protein